MRIRIHITVFSIKVIDFCAVVHSVSDPYRYHFDTDPDPDPGCEKICYRSGSRANFNTDPDPGKNDTDPDPAKKDIPGKSLKRDEKRS